MAARRHWRRHAWRGLMGLVVACCAAAPLPGQQDASAPRQSPILEFPDLGPIPGGNASALGPTAGAADAAADMGGSTAGSGILGGKQRTGRIPQLKKGRGGPVAPAARGMQPPEPLPLPVAPEPAGGGTTVVDAALIDDPGPADGLTLDAALDRMLTSNLDIRALRHELTQADADILTAGLRTNPLIYMDSQFIPYGSFSPQRPGGPTQYDINITLPMDLSQKRQSRTVVARMARSTIEAQFQDVTRRQIDNVYRAFVAVQAARIDRLAAAATLQRLEAEEAYDDVYLFYDPITFQDNSPFNAASTTSWPVGLTFALPIFNRNQGNIARAEAVLARRREQFQAGEITIDDLEGAVEDLAEVTQSHRDAVVRHRRAMLGLNTAVGLRLLP